MKLKNKKDDWDQSWTPEDYSLYSVYGDPENKPVGLHFLCPGCRSVIAVEVQTEANQPAKWLINFETLTATPSILHDESKGGCGWHGFLTNGELKPC